MKYSKEEYEKMVKIHQPMDDAYITGKMLIIGLKKSIKITLITTRSEAWGGVIGMMWMAAYWAILIPVWIYLIVQTV